jgi:hypothetical protein
MDGVRWDKGVVAWMEVSPDSTQLLIHGLFPEL